MRIKKIRQTTEEVVVATAADAVDVLMSDPDVQKCLNQTLTAADIGSTFIGGPATPAPGTPMILTGFDGPNATVVWMDYEGDTMGSRVAHTDLERPTTDLSDIPFVTNTESSPLRGFRL